MKTATETVANDLVRWLTTQQSAAVRNAGTRVLMSLDFCRTPMDVVTDPDMTVQEKRAILASWASDACAVEAVPDLRHPPSTAVVGFDDVMDALKRLDGDVADKPEYGKFINRARRWKDLYRTESGSRSPFV
jgi:hypothetical protein